MRTLTATTLALGAALAAFTAAPASALDRYEDGTRLSGASLHRAQLGSVAARGVGAARTNGTAGVATGAVPEPASASAPCPGGFGSGGGVYLNGWSLNGWSLNGSKLNGARLNGTGDAVETGALRVTAVRLPGGRALVARPR